MSTEIEVPSVGYFVASMENEKFDLPIPQGIKEIHSLKKKPDLIVLTFFIFFFLSLLSMRYMLQLQEINLELFFTSYTINCFVS